MNKGRMSKGMSRSLWVWAIAWVLWLLVQHASWVLNWNGIDLSNFNAICSDSQNLMGVPVSPSCQQASNWWGTSTFLFWVGIGAIIAFFIAGVRARNAAAGRADGVASLARKQKPPEPLALGVFAI